MWKRLRIGLASLLTRGTECTIVRRAAVFKVQHAAGDLYDYVNRSGGLQQDARIHAWREIFALATEIRDQVWNSEVAA